MVYCVMLTCVNTQLKKTSRGVLLVSQAEGAAPVSPGHYLGTLGPAQVELKFLR